MHRVSFSLVSSVPGGCFLLLVGGLSVLLSDSKETVMSVVVISLGMFVVCRVICAAAASKA